MQAGSAEVWFTNAPPALATARGVLWTRNACLLNQETDIFQAVHLTRAALTTSACVYTQTHLALKVRRRAGAELEQDFGDIILRFCLSKDCPLPRPQDVCRPPNSEPVARQDSRDKS